MNTIEKIQTSIRNHRGFKGNISKETAEHLLKNKPTGTFLFHQSNHDLYFVLKLPTGGVKQKKIAISEQGIEVQSNNKIWLFQTADDMIAGIQNFGAPLEKTAVEVLLPTLNLAHTQGKREKMEDATSMHLLNMTEVRDEEIPILMQSVVNQLQQGVNQSQFQTDDGTTFLTAIIKDNQIHIAYLGDSECGVLNSDDQGNYVFERLINRNRMHSVLFVEELELAENAGATIFQNRIYCKEMNQFLAITRSIHSDESAAKFYKKNPAFMQQITCLPPINLSKFKNRDQLVLSCDGLTEPDTQANQFINSTLQLNFEINDVQDEDNNPVDAAKLVQCALEIGSLDNVSVIIVAIADLIKACAENPGMAIVLNINDGHGGANAANYCANHLKTVMEQQILNLHPTANNHDDDDHLPPPISLK